MMETTIYIIFVRASIYWTYYGPVSGSGEGAKVKGGQAVVGAVWTEFGVNVDGRLVGGTYVGGGGYGWDRDRDRFNWWEDNVALLTLGVGYNAPLAYAL